MSSLYVLLAYACAFGLASFLLYWFGHTLWQWHAAAVGLALIIGIMPPLSRGPLYDLAIGSAFILAFTWGAGGAFVSHAHRPHHPRHA